MATSGTAYTDTYKTSKFYCTWTRTSYNQAGNYSDISWSAGLYISGSDQWQSNAIRINSVIINGTTVMGSTTISNKTGPGTFEMGSGTLRINHDNDGTKSFTISISGWLYSNHDLSGSTTFTLDKINRQATVTEAPNINLGDSATVKCTAIPSGATAQWRVETVIAGVTSSFAKRTGITSTSTTITFTDSELDYIYKAMGTGTTVTLRYVLDTIYSNPSQTFYSWLDRTCSLTGNIKTARTKVSGAWKRGKVFVKVNGAWKNAIVCTKVNGTWRRTA